MKREANSNHPPFIDNEDPANSGNLVYLATALRSLMDADPRPFYLSAAPQCPYPDASVPVSQFISTIDFWFVQFYKNPSCQVDAGPGFLSSLQLWSETLASGPGSPDRKARLKARSGSDGNHHSHHRRNSQHPRHRPATWRHRDSTTPISNKRQSDSDSDAISPLGMSISDSIGRRSSSYGVTWPLLFIGTAAFNWDMADGGGSSSSSNGYVTPQTYAAILEDVKSLNLPNLAGAVFWDGAHLVTNVEIVDGQPKTLSDVVRDVLRPHPLEEERVGGGENDGDGSDDDYGVEGPETKRSKRSMSNNTNREPKRAADVDKKNRNKNKNKNRRRKSRSNTRQG